MASRHVFLLRMGVILILSFSATAGDEQIRNITAGEPGYLLFEVPNKINVTSSTCRGARFYKGDVLLGSVKRGANTEMCQQKEDLWNHDVSC